MKMKWHLKATLATVFGLALIVAGSASAQVKSGRGIDARYSQAVNCMAEVTRLELVVQNLEAQRDAMINCNENNQVFDGTTCVNMVPPEAEWLPTPGKPSSLRFVDVTNKQIGNTVVVIRGRDGVDAVCPAGYEEE